MLDFLSSSFKNAFGKITGKRSLNKRDIQEALEEIKVALLEADVNYDVVEAFIEEARVECIGGKVLKSIKPVEQVIKIINDLLVSLMGEVEELEENEELTVLLMVGLNGVGKTSTSAKLGQFLKKKNKDVLLASCDVYRPAAIEQLQSLCLENQLSFFESDNKNAIKRAKLGYNYAKKQKFDYLILDTAGRLQIDSVMMKELYNIKKVVNPDEILFVVDAALGQEAASIAKEFNSKLGISGVILTKMDSNTKGGAAFSIRQVVKKGVKFITNGEKIGDLEYFRPKGFVSRILGMGDIVQLVENVEQHINEEEAKKLEEKLKKKTFNFNDFLSQLDKLQKMGGLAKLLSFLPGGGKVKEIVETRGDEFKKIRGMIHSMTEQERINPNILEQSRKIRIAKGSGNSVERINQFIKKFLGIKEMIGGMNYSDMDNMANSIFGNNLNEASLGRQKNPYLLKSKNRIATKKKSFSKQIKKNKRRMKKHSQNKNKRK